MHTYNYAEEIIKDEEYPLTQNGNVTHYSFPGDDDIVNEQEQNVPVNADDEDELATGNTIAEEKAGAFEEGIRNDDINIEDDSNASLNIDEANDEKTDEK